MTLEQKWDLVWPLACAVSHAIERFDRSTEVRDATTMMHMARQLKKSVDYINESNERLLSNNTGEPR